MQNHLRKNGDFGVVAIIPLPGGKSLVLEAIFKLWQMGAEIFYKAQGAFEKARKPRK